MILVLCTPVFRDNALAHITIILDRQSRSGKRVLDALSVYLTNFA